MCGTQQATPPPGENESNSFSGEKMAYSAEFFDCPICLQLLDDPVTTACGHSYCMRCINSFWDVDGDRGRRYSCPQCRHTFSSRPELMRNTLLAALLEDHKARNGQREHDDDDDDEGDGVYAAAGDVQCDACTGRKRKARMFCRVCLASYCDTHLQPHFEVAPLQKHDLIPASARARDGICGRHGKLLEIYCRTDRRCVCLLCVVDEHKGHDTVTVEAEKFEMERQLQQNKLEIADRVLHSERKMAELSQAADVMRDAAWKSCDDFERLCAERVRILVHSVEGKRREMREKVGEAEKAGVDWTTGHLSQLQREVLELRRREDELDQVSATEDPIQFLQAFKALDGLPVFTGLQKGLDMVGEFAAAQTDKLENMCKKEKRELFHLSEENILTKMLSSCEETTSRRYLTTVFKKPNMEVDPNTVAACLYLSDRNTEISWGDRDQAHPDHPDRFTFYHQALCKRGLEGSHYWEVAWDGGIVDLAVSYKGIKRKGWDKGCSFGHNELSWKLTCSPAGCTFWHNNLHKGQIPPVASCRVGVHLDYEAGTLDFYMVSDSDSLIRLHHTQTHFVEPLYPGFSVDLGSTLKIH